MKVLVIQPAFLGDAIISLALAEELRRLSPEAEISYLVRPESAPIINLSPSVNKVFTYDKYNLEKGLDGIKKKAEELNTEVFDIVFTLHSSKRTRMLLERLNAPQKIGYGSYTTLTDKVTEVTEPHTSKAIRLLKVVFPEADITTLPKLQPVESSLPNEVAKLPYPIIAIAPDSVWKTKQWGSKKFERLLEQLISSGYSIVLIGTKSNGLHIDHPRVIDLISKTSLETLVSIIAHSDLLISNDSAPIHIATAVGTKSIVIYGPTIPEFGFTPPSELGRIIQNEGLWCRPCASHGSDECPTHTHECMRSIFPEVVFQTALEVLV